MLRVALKITVIFSACFVAALLVLIHEFRVGNISPRSLEGGLIALCVATFGAVVMLFKSEWLRDSIRSLGPVEENRHSGGARRITVWAARVAVAVLVVLFVNGLLHVWQRPVAPRLVGLGANLLVTYSLIVAMRRLGRGQKR